ncbi:OmpA family protein [Myxococcota bacterium]|nr:OmpA family protein [Myxococcota bacterium]
MFGLLSWVSAAAFAAEGGIDLDRYKPPSDHLGYFTAQSADTLGHLQLGVAARANAARDPFVIVGADGEPLAADTYRAPVQSRVVTNLQLGLGVTQLFSLSADLPVVLSQTGYDVASLTGVGELVPLSARAIGDLRLTPKVAPLSAANGPLGLAVAVPISLPTGDPAALAGEGGLSVSPTLIAELSDGEVRLGAYRWRAAVNLGVAIRPDDRVRDVPTGDAVLYSLAAGFRPAPSVELIADLSGQSWGRTRAQSPAELDLGVLFFASPWLVVQAGGGFGLIPGLGTPDVRGVVGVSWAPSFNPDDRDRDRDDIADAYDACVNESEDVDGWQDEDGCPDIDNDGDGVEDLDDQCVDDPEDADGYRDGDGCPDSDNDLDTIPDMVDRCPDQAEVVNGFMDQDGCPDADPENDSDNDGFDDEVDHCPYDAEDFDNTDDLDGCPDTDNDGDGLLDINDRCPNAKEDMNGVEDDDGCPEDGRAKLSGKRIEITERVYFDTGKTTIKPESYGLLDEVAQVLAQNPQITLLRVEGHTDDQGADLNNLKLSQGRAEEVRNYLIQRGVSPERLVAAGFGEGQPVASNKTEDGRATNRRVEFIVLKVQ